MLVVFKSPYSQTVCVFPGDEMESAERDRGGVAELYAVSRVCLQRTRWQ